VFAPWTLTLAPGESLIVYTDGVTEALDESGELFSNERLLRELSPPGMDSAAAVAARVAAAVAQHAGEAERSDDITILVLRRPVA
jgi:sigma-B regulation protein RsbU (phosphoserine phosphatase)